MEDNNEVVSMAPASRVQYMAVDVTVCDKRLLATYTAEDGIREPHIVLDYARALGQTEAWDYTLLCI